MNKRLKIIKKNTTLYRTASLFFLSILLFGFVSSCGFSDKVKTLSVYTKSLFGGKLRVKVTIAENVNQNNPVALDLVVVYDQKLLDQLLTMSSREWFEKREQIKRDYLDGTGLDYWGWEWVPGQNVPIQELPLKSAAKGALVFANYYTPGVHRIRIEQFESIHVSLDEKGFSVEPL